MSLFICIVGLCRRASTTVYKAKKRIRMRRGTPLLYRGG
ncbi:hypothetical protein Z945_3394 [Sulfitobacter noctilucae]|nr:hypothetical protein Z945_3394 [Sulfitobacter noctilucae]